jgi:DNA-binding Xre family transcriptional regulator
MIQMARRGMNKKEMVEKSGVSSVTLSKILKGKTDGISLTTVIRICRGLDCDVNDLIGEKA